MKKIIPPLRFCPLVGLLLVLPYVRAEETSTPPLSLASALQRAAEHNPSLAALGYGERAAEALIDQAGVRPNPTLDIAAENFLGSGQVQGVRRLETSVQVSQTFERGGKLAKRVALAGRDRNIAAKELAVRRNEILAATAIAYAEVIAAQQRLALAEQPAQLARDTLAAVDARVKAGMGSPAESARARAAVASAHAEYARSQAALASARATLAATWGGNPAEVGPLHGSIRIPNSIPAEETLLANLALHPRLELQQAIIGSRRASLELAQSQAVQDITVGGGVRFLSEGNDAGFIAGISMPLPFHHKNQGNIRAARATLAGAEQTVRAVESELRAAFTAAWQDLNAAHAAAQNLRRDALPATREAHDIVRRAYDEGQLPLIDVLDAQRALFSLHREILEAEADYAVALARAEGLTSTEFTATAALLSTP